MNAERPAPRSYRACAGFARACTRGMKIVAVAAAAFVATVFTAAAAESPAGERATPASMHWAFQPLKAPRPSQAAKPATRKASIDGFIARRLREAGLTPGREADRLMLIRRV